jgi:hypothetical protein
MYFLRESDYAMLIQQEKLDTVIGDDCNIQRSAEAASQSEIESYLANRFDTAKIFSPLLNYTTSQSFSFFDRIFLDADPYSITKTYTTGNMVKQGGKVWRSIAGNSPGAFNPVQWTDLGNSGHYQLSAPKWSETVTYSPGQIVRIDYSFYIATLLNTNLNPQAPNGGTAWQPITALAGEIPKTSPYWFAGDSRSQHIVMRMIDLTLYHLHSRINPRNIPEFRIARRDEAIGWLRDISKGTVTPNLPIIIPEQGNNIVYGNAITRKNQYY